MAGGALASAAVQTYEMSPGWRCSYSPMEIALSAGIGGAAHGAGVAAAQMAPRVAGFFRGGACFAAGTPIAPREGSKPIEEIRAGDTVRTADPATGQQRYGKVVRTFVGEVEKILEVETADGARVKATDGHPFFVEGRGFIEARKLARGDLLRRVDGRRVAVVGLGWEEAHTRVYNFEVEGTHTYYAGGVWVHNAEPCWKTAREWFKKEPEVGRPHAIYPTHPDHNYLPRRPGVIDAESWKYHVVNVSEEGIVTDKMKGMQAFDGLALQDYLAECFDFGGYPYAVEAIPDSVLAQAGRRGGVQGWINRDWGR